ncbi:hypothetical protein AB0M44_44040 [Streptosporangium subroseum]|uniref:MmyB family transcriptional regulator n=1 Tax=Streptosporangium subroseum TaxID=106412 RepID=UPI00342B7C59
MTSAWLFATSEEFATLWDDHEVAVRTSGHKRIAHPAGPRAGKSTASGHGPAKRHRQP